MAKLTPSCILLAIALATAASSAAATLPRPNPIQLENAKPGTPDWNLLGATPTTIPNPSDAIGGYASELSVVPGDTLHLHVSTTPAASYRIEVYRLGWYQGIGARLFTCTPSCTGDRQGITRSVPNPDSTTGYLDAGWPITDTVAVGRWTSGYFVAKLVLTSGSHRTEASWVPFIVRSRPGSKSAILVQASVNTWEAYNDWGGKSLYTFNSTSSTVPASGTNAAAKVSFNRPLASTQLPFHWEYNIVRFLERKGYDASYQTDVDTDTSPSSLLGHRLDIVAGHDEYWSHAMRLGYQAAREAGVNLAFLGGDIGEWQLRYEDSDRTLVEYRDATLDPETNPAYKTVKFLQAPVNMPECRLLGVGYPGGDAQLGDPPRSYTVTAAGASSPWFAGTGLLAGSTVSDSVGYEWDSVQPGCDVPPLTVLLHFNGLPGAYAPGPADVVTYTAPSGAHVVSDGSMQVAWTLDDFGHPPHANAGMQRLFTNIFDALGGTPYALPPALLSPAPRSVLSSARPLFKWKVEQAPFRRVRTFVLVIDGRRVATTTGTSARPRKPLGKGPHAWHVLEIDKPGNTVASTTRRFTVR